MNRVTYRGSIMSSEKDRLIDIKYPDYPDNWGSGGGEGSGRYEGKKGYYVHWFTSEKHGLEGMIDSPQGEMRHVIQISKLGQEHPHNEYVEEIEPEGNTMLDYLQAKQKTWNKLVSVMRKINDGEMLEDKVRGGG